MVVEVDVASRGRSRARPRVALLVAAAPETSTTPAPTGSPGRSGTPGRPARLRVGDLARPAGPPDPGGGRPAGDPRPGRRHRSLGDGHEALGYRWRWISPGPALNHATPPPGDPMDILKSGDPELRGDRGRGAPPARRPGADRLGELHQRGGHGGRRLGPDRQVRRRAPRQAILRRLRIRRPGRAARDRPRQGLIRGRARQRPAPLGAMANQAVDFAASRSATASWRWTWHRGAT